MGRIRSADGAHPGVYRRQFVVGAAAAATAWSVPSIVRVDSAAAAVGSCVPAQVAWTGGFFSGGAYTITGSSNGLNIRATIRPMVSFGASPSVGLSGGRIVLAMQGQQIGDRWSVDFSFTASSGTICTAGLTVLDVDQNGWGLGCATNARFRDEINGIYGPAPTAAPQGAVAEVTPGTWASQNPCKTDNLDNLTLGWSDAGGVGSGGFTWRAGTPPGFSQTLDRQVILISPVDLCVVGVPGTLAASALQRSAVAGATGDVETTIAIGAAPVTSD